MSIIKQEQAGSVFGVSGRLKKAKKSFWDDFLINFLEQCE